MGTGEMRFHFVSATNGASNGRERKSLRAFLYAKRATLGEGESESELELGCGRAGDIQEPNRGRTHSRAKVVLS
jgi:hypothetical protein